MSYRHQTTAATDIAPPGPTVVLTVASDFFIMHSHHVENMLLVPSVSY